jgi:type IV pilus assembly protein PilV
MNKTFFPARQRGFSMLEALIALLVFSIGLLGLAGMQISSLKMNQSALYRSIASESAYAMLDKIRANGLSAKGGDYNLNLGDATPQGGAATATDDVTKWLTALQVALPNAQARICRRTYIDPAEKLHLGGCGSAGDFFVVYVEWKQGDAASTADNTLSLDDGASVEAVGKL